MNSDILLSEKQYRTNLVNALSSFKPLALIGTANVHQQLNLSVFNSLMHIGANPPLLGLIFRPDVVERHTLSNILETGYFTINLVSEHMYQQAHQTSARYPEHVSEFDAVGLHPVFEGDFKAPFVEESPIKMGMSFVEKLDIKVNGTHLVIGEVQHLFVEEGVIEEDGHLRPDKANVICCNGLDTYYRVAFINRLAYAKAPKVE
jgi:flavin reductase (DIM6/NTAB) family NADH-FMN oxidoreductase RutF